LTFPHELFADLNRGPLNSLPPPKVLYPALLNLPPPPDGLHVSNSRFSESFLRTSSRPPPQSSVRFGFAPFHPPQKTPKTVLNLGAAYRPLLGASCALFDVPPPLLSQPSSIPSGGPPFSPRRKDGSAFPSLLTFSFSAETVGNGYLKRTLPAPLSPPASRQTCVKVPGGGPPFDSGILPPSSWERRFLACLFAIFCHIAVSVFFHHIFLSSPSYPWSIVLVFPLRFLFGAPGHTPPGSA